MALPGGAAIAEETISAASPDMSVDAGGGTCDGCLELLDRNTASTGADDVADASEDSFISGDYITGVAEEKLSNRPIPEPSAFTFTLAMLAVAGAAFSLRRWLGGTA
ncbi:MAG: hypothetical protein R3C10_02965 [Pirellulales bacterium]